MKAIRVLVDARGRLVSATETSHIGKEHILVGGPRSKRRTFEIRGAAPVFDEALIPKNVGIDVALFVETEESER